MDCYKIVMYIRNKSVASFHSQWPNGKNQHTDKGEKNKALKNLQLKNETNVSKKKKKEQHFAPKYLKVKKKTNLTKVK